MTPQKFYQTSDLHVDTREEIYAFASAYAEHYCKYSSKCTPNTLLISGFPGTGKSFHTEYKRRWNERIWDSDSSKFNKDHFPDNYIEHIKEGIGFANVIFISSHKEVRDALVENGLDFVLIYPDRSLKEEYMNRFLDRGNNEGFVSLLKSNWNDWINELENQKGCKRLVLQSNQYISDVI